MKNLSVDIETFSSIDLTKSGVYRYAEAPDFEVILLGYSVDGGDVIVLDLASGDVLPVEIREALLTILLLSGLSMPSLRGMPFQISRHMAKTRCVEMYYDLVCLHGLAFISWV